MGIGKKYRRRIITAGQEQSFNTLENSLCSINISSLISGAPDWRGLAEIGSAETMVTVSAAAVQSGSPVTLTIHQMGPTFRLPAVNSGEANFSLGVDSVVDGQSFMAVTAGSLASTDSIPFTYVIVR